jgi:hypothetical protein
MREPVVLYSMRQQPLRQLGAKTRVERTQPEAALQLGRVPPARLLRRHPGLDAIGANVDLIGHERDQRGRRAFIGVQVTTRVAQQAQHQSIAEAAVIAAAALDHGQVGLGERVVPYHVTLFGRRIEQRGELRCGQFLSSRHVLSPGWQDRQSSRSGPGSRSTCCA